MKDPRANRPVPGGVVTSDLRPRATEGQADCVSGALACGLRDVVIELVGRAEVNRALASIPDALGQSFEEITPIGWIPVATLEAVFGAIAAQAGTNVAELHVRVARVSIERTVRTFWRMLLRFTTDQALVSRTQSIFARSYNRGRLEACVPTKGRGEITLHDWPNAPEWPIRATRIGIETVLRLAGRNDVRVTSKRTPTGAEYLATWR